MWERERDARCDIAEQVAINLFRLCGLRSVLKVMATGCGGGRADDDRIARSFLLWRMSIFEDVN